MIFPSLAAQFVEIDTSNTKSEFVGIIALAIAAISWSVGSLYASKADLPTNVLISTGMMLSLRPTVDFDLPGNSISIWEYP